MQTIADLRRFNGVFNAYRAFIPNAAEFQAPLSDLLRGSKKKKDKRPIEWTPELTAAFERYRNSIADVVRTSFLKPDAPLVLTTDVPSICLGGELRQLQQGVWRPLGLFSKKLQPAERNYSPYDREILAIFESLKHFEHLLEGKEFKVRTDHKPLVKVLKQRPEKASPRQLRQLDYISQFCLTLSHISGEDNVVADALSRVEAITMPTILDPATIKYAQKEEDITNDHDPATSSLCLHPLVIDDHRILCDIFTGFLRPYLQQSLRRRVFKVIHAPVHPSGRATCRLLKEKYVWPGVRKDALKWSRNCLACQKSKIHRHVRTPPTNIDVPDQRYNHMHLDIIVMPLPEGFRYCLTIMDIFLH